MIKPTCLPLSGSVWSISSPASCQITYSSQGTHVSHIYVSNVTGEAESGAPNVPGQCPITNLADLCLKCYFPHLWYSGRIWPVKIQKSQGVKDEEIIGQLPGLQVLETVVQVAVQSFHCRSDPGGIHLISNQDTKRRLEHRVESTCQIIQGVLIHYWSLHTRPHRWECRSGRCPWCSCLGQRVQHTVSSSPRQRETAREERDRRQVMMMRTIFWKRSEEENQR